MRNLLTLILAFTLMNTVVQSAENSFEKELKIIKNMDETLAKGGITDLLAIKQPFPLIHSQYYVDKIQEKPELKTLEQAKRDFGMNLAKVLDREAVKLQQNTTSEERAKQAKQMIDLSQWVKTNKAYGNYNLFCRCENLSTVPLAYLTADLKFPIESIKALRQRLTSWEEDCAFRVAVLNSEAPKPFIGQLSGNESEREDQIEKAWNYGFHSVISWHKANGKGSVMRNRKLLPEQLQFYCDDEGIPSPFITSHMWNYKRHSSILYSNIGMQVRNVDKFILFREKIGYFPTQPPTWWKSEGSLWTATEAAFLTAWKPYKEEFGPIDGTAAMVYQLVQEGRFYDRDTQYLGGVK